MNPLKGKSESKSESESKRGYSNSQSITPHPSQSTFAPALHQSRYAQAEMIGLLFIVLILAAGLLLYVRFSLSSSNSPNFIEHNQKTQTGESFVDALAQTPVDCDGRTYTVDDLVRQIAGGPGNCYPTDTNTNAENLLNNALKNVLNMTLDKQGINYRLRIMKKQGFGVEMLDNDSLPALQNPTIPEDQRCNDYMDATMDFHQVVINPFTAEIRLEQCS